MSSRKRARYEGAQQRKTRLAAAQSELAQLESKLAECQKLDEKYQNLLFAEATIVEDLTRTFVERDTDREMRAEMHLKSVHSSQEKIRSQLSTKGLPEHIFSEIEKTKSLIQDLSFAPTYSEKVLLEGPPSDVEKEGLYKVQMRRAEDGDGPLYECCFPADAQPPLPLSLAHHAFADFLDDFNNVSAQLDDHVCNFVVDLCFNVLGRMDEFHNEKDLQHALNRKLGRFLGHTVALDAMSLKTTSLTTDLTIRADDKWTALGELKLEKGATLVQGLQSYALYVTKSIDAAQAHLLPCFSIEVIGPTIRIGGLVFFEKVAWQPLTPFMNCFYTEHDRTDMATLCRAMRALEKGLTALGSYYTEVHSTIRPKDVPYRLQGRQSDRVGKKLIFIVTCDDGERRCFKYCRQYGERVHRSWAEAGLAPILHDCRAIAGGWLEVEMEYLTEDWMPASSFLKDLDEDARPDLRAAIASALKEALSIQIDGSLAAHGDMRLPNVMVKRDDGRHFHIKFIDFDWAGFVGVARYPPFMNTKLPWHREVGAGKLLKQEHDIWWLEDKKGAISPSSYHLLARTHEP